MTHRPRPACFESGDGPTVQIGYTNPNGQQCLGTLRVPGTDSNAFAYKVECLLCGYVYGVNSGDTHHRRCPSCQGGRPGIRYWLQPVEVAATASPSEVSTSEDGRPLATAEPAADWLERVSGSMKDHPEFEVVLELGRSFRRAD